MPPGLHAISTSSRQPSGNRQLTDQAHAGEPAPATPRHGTRSLIPERQHARHGKAAARTAATLRNLSSLEVAGTDLPSDLPLCVGFVAPPVSESLGPAFVWLRNAGRRSALSNRTRLSGDSCGSATSPAVGYHARWGFRLPGGKLATEQWQTSEKTNRSTSGSTYASS